MAATQDLAPYEHEPEPEGLEGTILDDRYEIERSIGYGGMGTVYLAQQLALRIPVAIKVLHRGLSEDFTCNYRFLREARVAARVGHPNVARVLDLGRTPDGRVFLVMEYLEGEDLSALLAREGALPWPRACRILRRIARGLEAAHAIGVIHRDIKPSNVFLVAARGDRPEQVKLLDFGVAKAGDPSKTFGEHLTHDGFVGTPDYMAPECALGEPANVRSDIFSLGVMMFEMLAGHMPWLDEGGPLRSHLRRICEPPSLPELLPGVPAEMMAVVRRAMAHDPAERFCTAVELEAALWRVSMMDPTHPRSAAGTQHAAAPRVAWPVRSLRRWLHTLRWNGEAPVE